MASRLSSPAIFFVRTTSLWVILAFLFPSCVCFCCRTRSHEVILGFFFLPCCLLKTTNWSLRSMNFLLLNLQAFWFYCLVFFLCTYKIDNN